MLKPLRGGIDDPDTPLTIEGGPFDRGDNFRSIVAFFSDGRLVVSKSHIYNPHNIYFIE
jgi:hypothetical protein